MDSDYREFQPHQYADFEALNKRASELNLRAVLSDEAFVALSAQAGRICLQEDFLRRETLVYLELPEADPVRAKFDLPEYLEERMTDVMYGAYPRTAL